MTDPGARTSGRPARQVFGRVLKELADLENPMRTLLGDESGAGGGALPGASSPADGPRGAGGDRPPSLDELEPRPVEPPSTTTAGSVESGTRRRHLPSVAPAPHPSRHRSRFDSESGTVLYNEQHGDFLLVKGDETALLDDLATLVAKEYVVYNNPRAAPDELAEELVRMLVRVRRHLPGRARRR